MSSEIPNYARWSRLSYALTDSLDLNALLLSLVTVALLWLGWSGLEAAFGSSEEPSVQSPTIPSAGTLIKELPNRPRSALRQVGGQLVDPIRSVMRPWLFVLNRSSGSTRRLQGALAGIWSLCVMSLVGCAIARVMVVRAADEIEGIGAKTALLFAFRRAGSLLSAPVGVLVVVGLLAIPGAMLGLLGRADSLMVHHIVSGLLFIPILCGLVMSLLLIGLCVGWPLMVLTVAAESEDGFDAVSRAFSYAGQRPIQVALMLAFGLALGLVGFLAVDQIAGASMKVARWTVSLGGSKALASGLFDPEGTAWSWGRFVNWILAAWTHSYFWAVCARVYLTLRREIDGTPWDDYFHSDRGGPVERASVGENPVPSTSS
jgi:hypothetical protein